MVMGRRGTAMSGTMADLEEPMERLNLAMPDIEQDRVVQAGEPRFRKVLKQHFKSPESDALERVVVLKRELKKANDHDFYTLLMREMTAIAGAQCGFVSKRIVVDVDEVKYPPLGDPGSCLLGTAFYLNGGTAKDQMFHDYRYYAHESPCAHMRHDKVFIIPEHMGDFVRNSPNRLPWDKSESFIGVPLFSDDGKCFAHFGMIWSEEGAKKRKLDWAFLEMFCHTLEDLILDRLIAGKGFATRDEEVIAKVVPPTATTASHSLKPYAKSLSHELRTPMQGVVGMLDIMHATVMEAIELQEEEDAAADPKGVFVELKANIELVQESSKRAVEAADNVVYAYDLNMEMPDSPISMVAEDDSLDMDDTLPINAPPDMRCMFSQPSGTVEDITSSSPSSHKRERCDSLDYSPGPPSKRLPSTPGLKETESNGYFSSDNSGNKAHSSNCANYLSHEGVSSRDFGSSTVTAAYCSKWEGTAPLLSPIAYENGTENEIGHVINHASAIMAPLLSPIPYGTGDNNTSSPMPPPFTTNLGTDHRHIAPRDFIRNLVDQAVRNMHPVHKLVSPCVGGEITVLRLQGPREEPQELRISVTVDANVPPRIITKELNLRWIVTKIVDNAIKFTPSGEIMINMAVSRSGQLIELNVVDTGCGIAKESIEHIFKPHYQEDATISRARDGLGLSLFNAKALARKHLNADVTLVRSDTQGLDKGSEFLIRFPLILQPKKNKFPSLMALTNEPDSLDHSPKKGHSKPGPLMSELPVTKGYMPGTEEMAAPAPIGVPDKVETKLKPRIKKPLFDRELAIKIPLRILIVEDNQVNRIVLEGYLKKLGYPKEHILLAFDGVEAVKEYEKSLESSEKIDCILMDLWMPNMDGYLATEKIMAMAKEQKLETPSVFAVTADITSDSVDRAKTLGMSGFISKPFKVMDVQKLIVDHFGGSQMDQ